MIYGEAWIKAARCTTSPTWKESYAAPDGVGDERKSTTVLQIELAGRIKGTVFSCFLIWQCGLIRLSLIVIICLIFSSICTV